MSKAEKYPYATLETHGYELDLIEANDLKKQKFLEVPIPTDDERFSVVQGDVVKLVFHYAQPYENSDQSSSVEHMWVVITNTENGILNGYLDNQPVYTELLLPGHEIDFHPEHIISIWVED